MRSVKKKPDDVLDEVPERKEAIEFACRAAPHLQRIERGRHLAGDILARPYSQTLRALLASYGSALAPCGLPRPQPAGRHAAAAARARDDMAALHSEVYAARLAVTSVREAGKP